MTVLVVVAGAFGAVIRFVVDGALRQRRATTFPWATLIINTTGSLLAGFLAGLVIARTASADVQVILGTGFCGGYSTFSTAAVDAVGLGRTRAPIALAYAVGSVVGSVAACAVGLALAHVV